MLKVMKFSRSANLFSYFGPVRNPWPVRATAGEAKSTASFTRTVDQGVDSSGVETRGAGGAGAPLKFVKGGLSPPEIYLFLVNTYLKVSLYILLAHALLYILTLQQLAMLVQRSGSRKGSTATSSVIS